MSDESNNRLQAHAYHQQKGGTNNTGFADMLAGMAADKSGKTGADTVTGNSYAPLRLVNPRIHLGTEIKLTAEQAAELDALKKAASSGSVYSHEYDNRAEPSDSKCLQKYEEVDKPNFYYQDEKALLDDLEEMGIISKEENTKVYARLAMVPPDWMHGGLRSANRYWTEDGNGNLIPSDIPYPTHYTSATRGMSLYDYLQGMISDENRLYDEGKGKYGEKAVAYMTGLMQTHQKLLAVLEEIKTGR